MDEKLVKLVRKIFRIAFAACLLGAGIFFLFAFSESYSQFSLSLTALFVLLSVFFGFNLLVLLIFWD